MNITFLIGNGFDLNLNLNTKYSDFYKYYLKKDPNDLISCALKKDYEKWSDLEIGLGEFLQNISEKQIKEFLDSKGSLENMLSEYLKKEEKRIKIIDKNALIKEFREKIINFFSDFNALEKDHYKNVIAKTGEAINYSFITFNYTNVLDNIIEIIEKYYNPFHSHVCKSTVYSDYILPPQHIHGKLTEDLILGIDNENQISNEELRQNPDLKNYIIKPIVNNALGEKNIEKAKEIIDKSKYICIFGLSIGETDEMWWTYIIKWLEQDSDNRLVLFIKEKNNVTLSGQEKLRFRDAKREFMFNRSKCNVSETIKQVKEKIIVVQNSKIFNLENIKVNNEPSEEILKAYEKRIRNDDYLNLYRNTENSIL